MTRFLDRWRLPKGSKRRYRRAGATLSGAYVAGGQRQCGEVVNISPGGVCLAVENADGLHEGGDGVFELTDFGGGVPARICYVVSSGVGLEFRVDDRLREALAAWLEPRAEADEPGA